MERSKQNQALAGPQFLHWFNKVYGIGDASSHLPPSFIFESSKHHMG